MRLGSVFPAFGRDGLDSHSADPAFDDVGRVTLLEAVHLGGQVPFDTLAHRADVGADHGVGRRHSHRAARLLRILRFLARQSRGRQVERLHMRTPSGVNVGI